MPKRNTLIPLKDKIAILDKSYQALESFIKKRLFGFTIYDEKKAKKLKAEIFDKIARQDKINRVWAGLNIPLAYNRAASIAKERLENIGAKVKKKRFDLVSSQSKKNGTLRLISYMNRANEKIRETVDQYFKLLKEANKKMAALQNFQLQNLVDNQEILQGTEKIIKASLVPVERVTKAGFTYLATPSRVEVTKDIKKLFQRVFGDFDFISITMKNGKVRNYKPNAYMKMLARTEMRAVQTQAIKDRCREYQNDLVTIPPHDDPCPICEPYQGQVFSLSGKHPFYPPVIDMPIHPNCEDHYSPTSEEAIANEKKFGKTFPEPYQKSIQERIDELRKKKIPTAIKPKPKPKIKEILTKRQIENRLQNIGIKNLDIANINDEKVLNEIYDQLIGLIEKENYQNNVKAIWSYSNGSLAAGTKNIIKLNEKFFNNYDKIIETIKIDIEKNFHPLMAEKETIKSIITHEFAHTLTIDEISSKTGLFKELEALRANYKKALYDWKGKQLKDSPAFISDYAARNLDEFTAEAFTMYKHSSNPSPFATKVGQLIDAKYKKGGPK